jgi:2-methylaconitate cis-trans-isomerase PrpF
MRSGTSRGPFFLREWLPKDDHVRDRVLQSAIGAADPSQINGLGGGTTLTSKVAMVSRSSRVDCDVDYLFAQVGPNGVDTRPNCGNMLAGVAPFAVEQGLIAAVDGMTTVRVNNVNTGARIDVQIHTPNGQVVYDGGTGLLEFSGRMGCRDWKTFSHRCSRQLDRWGGGDLHRCCDAHGLDACPEHGCQRH